MLIGFAELPRKQSTCSVSFLLSLKLPDSYSCACRRGAERKWPRLAEEEARAGTDMAITAYGVPLAPVTSFKYLGRFIVAEDDNWPVVVHNLWRAR